MIECKTVKDLAALVKKTSILTWHASHGRSTITIGLSWTEESGYILKHPGGHISLTAPNLFFICRMIQPHGPFKVEL